MIHSSLLSSMRSILAGAVVAAAFVAAPALADKDRSEHGPKIQVHDNGKDYKYEYKDPRCKYEYKLNYRTGEEKVEQKGDCRAVSPRRALYDSDVVYEEHEYERGTPRPSSRHIACNREVIGTVLGGVAGGVAGSHVGHGDGRKVATVAGAIIGAVIGGNVGRRMDRADTGCAYQAFEFAAPGETVFWRNPDSEMEYRITPARLSRRPDERECRAYRTSVIDNGADQASSSGVACRRSDGSWEIE